MSASPARAAPITRAGWAALTIVSLTQMMSLLDRQILAILAPRIKAQLHIGDAEMGLLYGTVFALFYALFSLPLGRLADGWKRARLLAICIAFWSLATGWGAFAAGFAGLALSRLGVGIGEAATQPAGTSLVYDHFPKARRGFAMAMMASAIALGLGLSSVLGGVAAGWWDARFAGGTAPLALAGWQFAFLVAAAPGAVLCVALWRMAEPVRGSIDGIPAPADPAPFAAAFGVLGAVLPGSNWLLMARAKAAPRVWAGNFVALAAITGAMVMAARASAAASPRPPLQLGTLRVDPHTLQWSVIGFGLYVIFNLFQSLRRSDPVSYAVFAQSRALQLCIAIGALQSLINYGVMGFTPALLMKNFHLSPAEVGLKFGLLSAGIGVAGALIAGPLSDWLAQRLPGTGRVWVTLFALGLSPLIALWTYHAGDIDAFYHRFVLYSVVLTMWLPPLYAVMYEQVLPRMRAITTSLYLVVMTILGLGIGPYLVGMIADANHGDLVRAVLSINWVSPLIVVLLLWLAQRGRSDEARLIERARAAGEPI